MLRVKENVIGLGLMEGRILEFLHREKRHLPRDPTWLLGTESSSEAGGHTFSVISACTLAWLLAAAHVTLVVMTEKSNGRNDEGWGFYGWFQGREMVSGNRSSQN